MLASVPALQSALEQLQQVDRLVASLIDGLIDVDDHQVAEVATKVPLEQWLAIVGRRTRADRRMLLTACEVLRRLPSLREAFCRAAEISWAQTRAIALQVHHLPRHLDDSLDAGIAQAIAQCAGADPDALATQIGWVISDLRSSARQPEQSDAPIEEFLAMQPRLDGSGGRVWGEFGPLGFATLDAALSTGPPDAGGSRDHVGQQPDPRRSRRIAATVGRARARQLISLCDDHMKGGVAPESQPAAAPVQLLVRPDLDMLLDRSQSPATLLTHLLGGRMWLDAATARALIDARGADLRTVVLDETGKTVGVGRRRRIAPGWLKDAALAVHDTCSAPGCLTAARVCDLDHARPWTPRRSDGPPGPTDADQLAPLCRTDNRVKERDGWTVVQHPDGTRTWRHDCSGLATRTHPSTRLPRGPARSRAASSRSGTSPRAGPVA